MKSLTHFLFFSILIAMISGCSAPKSVPLVSYPPLIDSLAMRDTIPLFDWEVGDKQWQRMRKLSTKRLIELTNHPKGNIKVFALLSLFRKNDAVEQDSIDFFSILNNHAFDTSNVKLVDIVNYPPQLDETVTASEVFLTMIGGYRFSSRALSTGLFFIDRMIDEKELKYIDSLLICRPPFYDESNGDLQFSFSSNPNIRSCILERIEKYGNTNYTIALAKFQNQEDIPLILNNLPKPKNDSIRNEYRWYPFVFFQHPTLFDFLKKHWKKSFRERRLIEAFVKYQNLEAAIYLDSIYETTRKSEAPLGNISNAIQSNYHFVYADLFLKILKGEATWISLRTENLADSIWKHRPDKMYELYIKWQGETLRSSKDRVFNSFPSVAYYLEKSKPEILVETIMKNVKNGSARLHNTYSKQNNLPYLKYIKKSGNLDFGQPIFELLKNEKSGAARVFFSKFLLGFDPLQFENKLKEYFDENSNLKPAPWEEKKGNAWYSDFIRSL